jgi:glycosyltransferase involved in cell wall biosynthesis
MNKEHEPAIAPERSPTVSVIIPTYNRSKTLGDAMASVLSQSWTDLELIVVDDGSVEDVEPIVLGLHDPRVKFSGAPRMAGPGPRATRG